MSFETGQRGATVARRLNQHSLRLPQPQATASFDPLTQNAICENLNFFGPYHIEMPRAFPAYLQTLSPKFEGFTAEISAEFNILCAPAMEAGAIRPGFPGTCLQVV